MCLFAVVSGIVSCGSGGKSAESVAKSYVSAWAKVDFKTMINLSTGSNKDDLVRAFDRMNEQGNFDDYANPIKENKWKFTLDGEPVEVDTDRMIVKFLAKERGETAYSQSAVALEKSTDGKWVVV